MSDGLWDSKCFTLVQYLFLYVLLVAYELSFDMSVTMRSSRLTRGWGLVIERLVLDNLNPSLAGTCGFDMTAAQAWHFIRHGFV